MSHPALETWLQPIVDLEDGSVVAYEVLLRVLGPSGRPGSPVPLIAEMEASGNMDGLDRWAAARAVELLSADPALLLQVNVSAATAAKAASRYLGELGSALAQAGVSPARLTIEITETTHAEVADMARFATATRGFGAGLALDDLGAGTATVAVLNALPFDQVKLSGGVVRHYRGSQIARRALRHFVGEALRCGVIVVAEAVPDHATAIELADMGVQRAQAFIYGRPRSASQVLARSARSATLSRGRPA